MTLVSLYGIACYINVINAFDRSESSEVSRPIIHAPMPPQKPRTKGLKKRQPPQPKSWDAPPPEVNI